jgi:hypothetical protein
MPDNEFADIEGQIRRLNHAIENVNDPQKAAFEQALALAYLARELNKFNFREKHGPGAK